jgi:2-oxoglutarate ferredoxin oxidoreductase subunit delta
MNKDGQPMSNQPQSGTRFWRQPLDRQRIQVPHGIVRIIEDRCKGCGFCVEFCPRHLLSMSPQTNSKGYHPPRVEEHLDCVNCGLCELLCPDFAIYVEDGGLRSPESVVVISGERRP